MDHPPITPQLGLWDTISIIVGIIIGVGIFKAPSTVFQNVAGPWEALGVWALGGVLSILGALCFGELASTYPRSGGDYIYLTRAYGPWVGFLFAWAQLAVIRTGGSIAAPAYVFAVYADHLFPMGPSSIVLYALAAIAVLSLINIVGIKPGKRTQNLLTISKVLGIAGIIFAGFLRGWKMSVRPNGSAGSGSFALAMIFVLYTYDGWNEAAYVAAEVRNCRRNLPLALVVGTVLVMVIYLLVNAAYLVGLGFLKARASQAPAAEVLGNKAAGLMSSLVMISALGGINGTIFTGSRIYSEMGSDFRLFAILGRWSPRWGTPAWSILIQAFICMAMVAAVGIWWNKASDSSGESPEGFEMLMKCTSPIFWLFFLLTGLALFILRVKDRFMDRPFRVPFFPLVPLVFCGWCGYMLYGSIAYARTEALVGIGILLPGVPLYWVSRRYDSRSLGSG